MGSGFLKKRRAMQSAQLEMQQAQVSMMAQMETLQVEGQAGNGLVKVLLTGSGRVERVAIHPDCVRADDVEGLQDLITAAFNHAATRLEEATKSLMGRGFPSFSG